jgi:hypothetical protein
MLTPGFAGGLTEFDISGIIGEPPLFEPLKVLRKGDSHKRLSLVPETLYSIVVNEILSCYSRAMARIARIVAPGIPHHVTQRGNRRQPTFFGDDDYRQYLVIMLNNVLPALPNHRNCPRGNTQVWSRLWMSRRYG